MSTLQVRDIPEPLSRALKSRAAAAGQSLSSYVLDRLSHAVEQPTAEEVIRQIAGRESPPVSDPVEELRLGREQR